MKEKAHFILSRRENSTVSLHQTDPPSKYYFMSGWFWDYYLNGHKYMHLLKMLWIQKCIFAYSVDYIYNLDPIETNAIQMHNSVIVLRISEFRVFTSMIGVLKCNKISIIHFFLLECYTWSYIVSFVDRIPTSTYILALHIDLNKAHCPHKRPIK